MAALYKINIELLEKYGEYEASIDPETGEVMDETEDLLRQIEALKIDRFEKVENIGCLIKNLRSDAEQIKAEADKLTKRAKAAQNKADRLKSYLEREFFGEKYKSSRVAISWGRTKSVNIIDESLVPQEFLTTKVEVNPNKKEIGAVLKAGGEVSGCVLEEKQYIKIQ